MTAKRPWRVKTHCLRGHEFTAENTWHSQDGRQHCRLCRSFRRKQAYEKKPRPTPAERFWPKIVQGPDDCWEWTGTRGDYGHGAFFVGGRSVKAHRWCYEQLIGDIPEGLVLDHLCRNPPCVNPWHLDPVPHGVNVLRGDSFPARNRRKTHCKWGHEFTPENVYPRSRGRGRQCRTCALRRAQAGRVRIGGKAA